MAAEKKKPTTDPAQESTQEPAKEPAKRKPRAKPEEKTTAEAATKPAAKAEKAEKAPKPEKAAGGKPEKAVAEKPEKAPAARHKKAEEKEPEAPAEKAPSLAKLKYVQDVAPKLITEFSYKNVMQVPRLKKIVLNIGLGEAITNAKAMEAAEHDLTAIGGQKPVITKSKKSIAAFKIRTGMPIGMMVTLRGQRMYDFFDKLVNISLPRLRDFQGVPRNAFDGRGSYSLGFKEQLVFPEIEYDKIDKPRGLQVTIVTSARTDDEARRLLELMGMAFAREQKQ